MNRQTNHQNNLMILTGGKSRRMGSDKATLPFGRSTVIEYMVLNYLPYFDHIYISVSDEKQLKHLFDTESGTDGRHCYRGQIPEQCLERISFVSDIVANAGPTGGLYSLFHQTDLEDVYVVAVDMPFAAPEHLLAMKTDRPGDCYSIAVHTYHKEPLFGWYHRDCLKVLDEMMEQAVYKLGYLHKNLPGTMKETEPWRLAGPYEIDEFFNMNSRDDYYLALDAVRAEEHRIPCVSFAGWSNTGKTTYIEQLIPKLMERGIRLAVIKRDGHEFEMDKEGKDTWRYKAAGASEILIASSTKYAKISDTPDALSLEALMQKVDDVDLIIVEGWKHGTQPKILLQRCGASLLEAERLVNVIGIVSDDPSIAETSCPVFEWDDFEGVAELITEFMLEIKNADEIETFLENL